MEYGVGRCERETGLCDGGVAVDDQAVVLNRDRRPYQADVRASGRVGGCSSASFSDQHHTVVGPGWVYSDRMRSSVVGDREEIGELVAAGGRLELFDGDRDAHVSMIAPVTRERRRNRPLWLGCEVSGSAPTVTRVHPPRDPRPEATRARHAQSERLF